MKGFLENQHIPIPYVSSPDHPGVLKIDRRELIDPLVEIVVEVEDYVIMSSDTYFYELRRHPVLRGVAQRSGPESAR